jgi:hypothetical protein
MATEPQNGSRFSGYLHSKAPSKKLLPKENATTGILQSNIGSASASMELTIHGKNAGLKCGKAETGPEGLPSRT